MEQIECSETSAYINQTPGNHPKENKQRLFLLFVKVVTTCASPLGIPRIFTEVGLSLESKVNCLDVVIRYDRVVVAELLCGNCFPSSYS